jgi:hypothetical protein
LITSETRTEWEARTARGALIKTFQTRAQATKWWDDPDVDRAGKFPGARLEEVTTELRVIRRTLRRPALELVRSA